METLWDLTSLWPGFESVEYEAATALYQKLMDEMDALLDKATGTEWLEAYLALANQIDALEESLNAYAYAQYSTDTTNGAFLNQVSRLELLRVRSRDEYTRFCRYLADSSLTTGNDEKYRPFLEEAREDGRHLMSRDEERLASDLERTGAAAWGRLQEQIISNLKDPSTGKAFNTLRNEASHADRAVRRRAWNTELSLLKGAEIPLAACLNNLKGATVTLNARRTWDSALARSLHSARMSRSTLDALISAIEGSLPMWRTYLRAKGRFISGQNKGCAFYDLFAPLPADVGPAWTFKAAAAYVVERFTAFSPEMGAFARDAFDKHWIDADIRAGKVGGAYCIDFPLQHESRILCNFGGAFSDVLTIAHELGHAYHHRCIADMDPLLQHYPMTLAETASIFAETIVMEDMIEHTQGAARLALVEQHLQDACQVLVDILCRFYFEQAVFHARKTQELGPEDFCRFMRDAQERTYGDGLAPDARHEYMWGVKSHYYSPHLDFYNFPYAFGQLFALALYGQFREAGAAFPERYVAMLKKTGSASCEEVCLTLGWDITKSAFWEQGIAQFAPKVAAFAEAA